MLTVIVAVGSAASGAASAHSDRLGLVASTLPGPDQNGVSVCSIPRLPKSWILSLTLPIPWRNLCGGGRKLVSSLIPSPRPAEFHPFAESTVR